MHFSILIFLLLHVALFESNISGSPFAEVLCQDLDQHKWLLPLYANQNDSLSYLH